jgi:hypothetical protein
MGEGGLGSTKGASFWYTLEERLLRRRSLDRMISVKRPGGRRAMWPRAGLGMASVNTVLISGLRHGYEYF